MLLFFRYPSFVYVSLEDDCDTASTALLFRYPISYLNFDGREGRPER